MRSTASVVTTSAHDDAPEEVEDERRFDQAWQLAQPDVEEDQAIEEREVIALRVMLVKLILTPPTRRRSRGSIAISAGFVSISWYARWRWAWSMDWPGRRR
jgi:hypothetical protein